MKFAKLTVGAALISAVSYLVYFDYQRRNSPQFRKQLRQNNKRFSAEKERAVAGERKQQRKEMEDAIDRSYKENPVPEDIKAREQFFIAEIANADALGASGDHFNSALSFYRALASYPQPMELLGLYEKSIQPKEIFEIVRAMIVVRPPPSIAHYIKQTLQGGVE